MEDRGNVITLAPWVVRLSVFIDLFGMGLSAHLFVGPFNYEEAADEWLHQVETFFLARGDRPYGGAIIGFYLEEGNIEQESPRVRSHHGLIEPPPPASFVEQMPKFTLEKIGATVGVALAYMDNPPSGL